MKKFLGIILCLLLLSGCTTIPKLSTGEELVAELDGAKITVDSLYNSMKDKYAHNVLVDMIDILLLNKLYEIDEEMNQNIDNQIEYIKYQTKDNFLMAIKEYYGINSEEELRNFLALYIQRNMATEDYVRDLITDKEINDYYKKEIVGDIRASHILIKPNVTDEMTSAEIIEKEAEALVLAKEIITKLNNQESFGDLAKEYSDDSSNKDTGGDLGYFNKGTMTKVFEDEAYKLNNNEYTKEPVKTEFGYHIILKIDQKAKPELSIVRENIIDTLANNKLADNPTLNSKALIELRKNNNLKIYDTEIKKQYDNYMDELLKASY